MAYPKRKPADAGPDEVKALREAIAADSLARLYVFHGEETYLRDHYLSEMKKLLCGELPELNFELFDGKSCTPEVLREAILAYPAFGGRRLVVARDCDIIRATGGLAALAEELFPELPDTTTLVFLYDTLEYRLPTDKEKDMLQLVRKHGRIVDFRRADPPALEKWVCSHFRALGKECSREVAQNLIFLSGGLMNDLYPEIQKIGHFAADDTITAEDVRTMVIPTVDAKVFEMTDAVLRGDTTLALRELSKLFATGEEPIMISAALAKQLRQYYTACVLAASGWDEGEFARLTGTKSPYVINKFARMARSADLSRARERMMLCAETDLALKSSGGDRQQLLELLVLRLAGKDSL